MTNVQHNGLRVVAGLGKTGLSCVRYLKWRGYSVAVTDTRENPPGLSEVRAEFPDVEVSLGKLDVELLLRAKEIIASPGLSVKEPVLARAAQAGIPVIGDIELFCREVTAPVVAITGSNAKSTVTSLLGLMAQNAGINVGVGGNLGLPVLDMLRENGQQALYVLELSSFQLETTYSLKAAVAVILNISEDHMDRYSTMQEYIAAKQRIFHECAAYVANRDDAFTSPESAITGKWSSFGMNEPAEGQFGVCLVNGEKFLALGQKSGHEALLPVSAMKIRGDHNVANALATLALGQAIHLPMDVMLKTLTEFRGLPHRCELVAEKNDIAWYNDSKGTNVGSTLAAIKGLGAAISGKLILIAGGVGKGQDFTPLSEPLQKYAKALVLIGEDGSQIGDAVSASVEHIHAGSLEDAIQKSLACAKAGDAVVLSPACASFDMFKNYEDRGHKFVAAVHAALEAS